MKLTTFNKANFSALIAMAVAALVSPFAMAAGESAPILATFNEYKVEAVILVVAFCVVLWVIRGALLLKPKG